MSSASLAGRRFAANGAFAAAALFVALIITFSIVGDGDQPARVRLVIVVLGALLLGHAFVSQWLPPWVLFIPFVLIPVWLALAGRWLAGATLLSERSSVPGRSS